MNSIWVCPRTGADTTNLPLNSGVTWFAQPSYFGWILLNNSINSITSQVTSPPNMYSTSSSLVPSLSQLRTGYPLAIWQFAMEKHNLEKVHHSHWTGLNISHPLITLILHLDGLVTLKHHHSHPLVTLVFTVVTFINMVSKGMMIIKLMVNHLLTLP